jgi:hypothetical protein
MNKLATHDTRSVWTRVTSIALVEIKWVSKHFVEAMSKMLMKPSDELLSFRVSKFSMSTLALVERMQQSDVALAFLTSRSIASPWVYYEMGAAHASQITFIPCLTGSLNYVDLPPQAYEYQGVLL